MQSRKYPSINEAKTHLEEKGTLKFWGRIGAQYEICLYTYTLHDGRKFDLHIYNDGLVEIREDYYVYRNRE